MEESNSTQDVESNENLKAQDESLGQEQPLGMEDKLKAEAKNYRLRMKKYRDEVDELKGQLTDFKAQQEKQQLAKLENEGNWKEVATQRAKELEIANNSYRRLQNELKYTAAKKDFETLATSKGCVDPTSLFELVEKEITLNADNEVDRDMIDYIIDREKQGRSYMFKSTVPDYKTGAPAKTKTSAKSVDMDKMSKADRLKLLKDLGENSFLM